MADTPADIPAPPPVPFFKKKSRPRPAARQRSPSPGQTPSSTSHLASEASSSAVKLPSKKTVFNPLVQGTKRKSAKEDYEDDDLVPLDGGVGVNWQTSGKAKANGDNFVTGGLDWDADEQEEEDKRKRLRLVDAALNDGIPDDGMYHGAAAYKTHIEQRESGVSAKMKAGPQKASSNIRTITVVDYQPDVCKDYKETGWCGFGDTCKFLHDRGDYLSGWQLDAAHERSLKDSANALEPGSSDEDEDIPFACLICRNPFKDPVVTKCGHYFDSACAIKRFAKTPKCFACGAPTGGMFNAAGAVLKKMEGKQKAKEKRRREERGTPEPEDGGLGIESGEESE